MMTKKASGLRKLRGIAIDPACRVGRFKNTNRWWRAPAAALLIAFGIGAPGAQQPATGSSASSSATAAPLAWTPCAGEGQTCTFTGQKQVRYGAGSTFSIRTFSNGTPCSNATFGDPAVGVAKRCSYADIAAPAVWDSTGWTLCASEGRVCAFTGTRQVRYGSTTVGTTREIKTQTACTDAVFGDPAVGATKSCWVSDRPLPTWTTCAAEGEVCTLPGIRAVHFGTATAFVSATYAGSVACNSAVFGNPAGNLAKSCSYASVANAVGTLASTAASSPASRITLPAVTASAMGVPTKLSATVRDAKGATVTGADLAWAITDPTLATVDANGLATPLRTGFSTVTATTDGQSATGILTVRGPMPIPVRSQYVGTNLGGIAYYGSNFPFANMMKSGGGWGPKNDDQSKAPFPGVSADGYPTSLLAGQHATAPVAWSGAHHPAGRYTLLWDGKGSFSFPLSRLKTLESTPNRMVVEPVDLSSPIWLSIDSTDPADPVRNVRFLWPGTEPTYRTQPFNPMYLQKIAPFSMLRFMDWGATNGSPVVEWADRPLPTQATYTTGNGVPIEVMIDLANTMHADPWFCIPHKASDDYVRQFATLLHSRLDPTLRPHIEYSNEMWNHGFAQTGWAKAQSDAQGLQRPWGTPSIFYARRAVQMFKTMEQVYGPADSYRLVRVLAGQAAWTQFLENALADADTANNVDALAIAPYFQADSADKPANVAQTLASTPDQIVDQFLVSLRGNIRAWMTANVALASKYHLTLKAYESGPGDTVGYFPADKQDPMTNLLAAANASPRMKDVYIEYWTEWKQAGGSTMNQFVDISAWTKWGFWGALQQVIQDPSTSPKYQGLMAFIAANPTTTGRPAREGSPTDKR